MGASEPAPDTGQYPATQDTGNSRESSPRIATPSSAPDSTPVSGTAAIREVDRSGAAAMEEIHRVLRQRILAEEYAFGRKLSENALAREFGCSRTPIREAFKRLESENLIEIRPQSGTYVRMLTSKEFTEVLEVRAYLEGLAYRLAIVSADDASIEGLAVLLSHMDTLLPMKPQELRHYAELHYQFHFAIVTMSGNVLLARMFERLNLRSSHMFLQSMDSAKVASTRREHYRILELLKTRNPAGERFVIGHLWRNKLRAESRTASQAATGEAALVSPETGDRA